MDPTRLPRVAHHRAKTLPRMVHGYSHTETITLGYRGDLSQDALVIYDSSVYQNSITARVLLSISRHDVCHKNMSLLSGREVRVLSLAKNSSTMEGEVCSQHSGDGSNTDSGRGASEEGEKQHL
ncbi:hypothetical protein CAPTEDRAFT_211702, partial [Capitella teleta]